MADLLLVRHGQASFGEAVYDELSPLGRRQAQLLGGWWRRCGLRPDLVATGRPRRQVDTAALCLAESGGPAQADWLVLDGLGEYDHEAVVAVARPEFADPAALRAHLAFEAHPRRAFHEIYVEAIARWVGGAHDGDYAESWSAFKARVLAGLTALLRPEARTIAAFTSGGPITAIIQHLLAVPDAKAFDANWPLVNAGLTRLRFSAESGAVSLATYNAHPHLDETGEADLVTFR